jgi:hypothetical protein
LQSGEDYLVFELFSNGKTTWTRSTSRGPRRRRSTVDLGQGVGDDLTRARPSGRSGAWWLIGDGATEREGHEESISGFTEARAAAWRPGNDGEEMAEEVLGAGGAWARREEMRRGREGEVWWRMTKLAQRSPGLER